MPPPGFSSNHAEPAWTLSPTRTAVDSPPHTWLPSNHVLKMRVSLLSSGPSTSFGDGASPAIGQPIVRQSRSGTLPAFCSLAGGTTYTSDGTCRRVNPNARWLLSSELVFVRFHNPMTFVRPSGLPV